MLFTVKLRQSDALVWKVSWVEEEIHSEKKQNRNEKIHQSLTCADSRSRPYDDWLSANLPTSSVCRNTRTRRGSGSETRRRAGSCCCARCKTRTCSRIQGRLHRCDSGVDSHGKDHAG